MIRLLTPLALALALLACQWRDNDPNDASKGRTKVVDCHRCDCPSSSTQHNYYHGRCLGCGRSQ